jgi:hypothetical protein
MGKVTNQYRVSYPGYSEILTGRTQDDVIKGNDPIRNPTRTMLEFLRLKLGLPKEQVALFASWERFNLIGEATEGQIVIKRRLPAARSAATFRRASPSLAACNRTC